MEKRIAKWDNIKFVLIYLVVLGHIINPYTGKDGSESMNQMYMFIWTFHMPAFIFISGLFSKKTIDNKKYDKMFSFLILYFVIKFLVALADFLSGSTGGFSVLSEYGVPWYAFVMFVYYLLTVVTSKYSKIYVMVASIVLSMFVGFDSEVRDWLMLSRIIVFYPFFYAGYIIDKDKLLEFTRKKWVKVLGIIIFAIFIWVIYSNIDYVYKYRPLVSGRNGYKYFVKGDLAFSNVKFGFHMVLSTLPGLFYKIAYYVIVAVICVALFALVPERRIPFISKIGANTLSIYAIHEAVVIMLFDSFDLNIYLEKMMPGYFRMLYLVVALIITCILSLPVFGKIIDVLIHPKKIKD